MKILLIDANETDETCSNSQEMILCQSLQIIRSLQSTDARRVWDAIAMNDKKDDKPAADQLEPDYR